MIAMVLVSNTMLSWRGQPCINYSKRFWLTSEPCFRVFQDGEALWYSDNYFLPWGKALPGWHSTSWTFKRHLTSLQIVSFKMNAWRWSMPWKPLATQEPALVGKHYEIFKKSHVWLDWFYVNDAMYCQVSFSWHSKWLRNSGILSNEGVVLAAERRNTNKLLDEVLSHSLIKTWLHKIGFGILWPLFLVLIYSSRCSILRRFTSWTRTWWEL